MKKTKSMQPLEKRFFSQKLKHKTNMPLKLPERYGYPRFLDYVKTLFFKSFVLVLVGMGALGLNGQTIYLSSVDFVSACSYDSEKWISITTQADGAGTVVWAQGNGTVGNASGGLDDVTIDISAYCGVTLYLNAYDQYHDSWDGCLYEVRDAAGGLGNLIINNGGVSPDFPGDNGGWLVEVSEAFSVPCPCTAPTVSEAVIPNCATGFSIDVTITDLGGTTGVDITDGATTFFTNVDGTAPTYNIGPFTPGTDVTVYVNAAPYNGCDYVSAVYTEVCACTTKPTATVNALAPDCTGLTYDVEVTISNDGDGDANMSDILIDGNPVQADAMAGTLYSFTVPVGEHIVAIAAEGAAFVSCVSTDYAVTGQCNGSDDFSLTAPNILGTCIPGDLSVATPGMAQGFTGGCHDNLGVSGSTGNNFIRDCSNANYDNNTNWVDVWYQVDLPDGSDEMTLEITGLNAGEIVGFHLHTGNPESDAGNTQVFTSSSEDCSFFDNNVNVHTITGLAGASTAPMYIRILSIAFDDGAGCADIVNPAFTICASAPQPNDICGDALSIDGTTVAGDLCAANMDTESNETCETGSNCSACTEVGDANDLWYRVDMDPADPDQFLKVTIDFTNATDEAIVTLYSGCFSNSQMDYGGMDTPDCTIMQSTGAGSSITHTFGSVITAGGSGSDWYVRVTPVAGNSICDFAITGNRVAENNTCEVFQDPFTSFDIATAQNVDFNYATDSGGQPIIEGNDLWFGFDPASGVDNTDPANPVTTYSTSATVNVSGLAAGEQLTLALYRGNIVSENNCTDLFGDFLSTLVINGNGNDGNFTLSCLDELHAPAFGGYLLRIVQTGGATTATPTVTVTPNAAGPYNNDCENVWNTTFGGVQNSGTSDAAHQFSAWHILDGETITGNFTGSTDCHPDLASAYCNNSDYAAFPEANERDVWFTFEVPDNQCATLGLTQSTVLSSMTLTYNANDAFRDGILYVYDVCGDGNLIDCSGILDGAGTSWTVNGLTQGEAYLVRVKPSSINSNFDYSFDLTVNQGDVAPCNNDAENAESLSVNNCLNYSVLETWSTQGATESAPVGGAPESDVWFTFTAPGPEANGGFYSTSNSWVTVFFESVSGEYITVELYNTTATVGSSLMDYVASGAGDQAWAQFGNLVPGRQYWIRMYHKETIAVDVQYKIAITTGTGEEPGWACGENTYSNPSGCSAGCGDLREQWFKIDLPDATPENMYWMIEVFGYDEWLDFELRSKYLSGSSSYVNCNGVEGAGDGSCADFDHPCSSTALEPAVSLSSETALMFASDLNGTSAPSACDDNTTPGIEGRGMRKVYFNMNGTVPGQKDYYYLRVFLDPNSPNYDTADDVSICQLNFSGPYMTEGDADAGGTPNTTACDPACAVSDVAVNTDGVCNGLDATFTLSFDVVEGSGFYEIVATADNADYGITAGDVLGNIIAGGDETELIITGTVAGPTSPTDSISVTVRDQVYDYFCEGSPVTVNIPMCPTCMPDAGDISNNSSTPGTLGICVGNDLLNTDGSEVVFSVDYSAADEFDPGNGIDYAFILIDGPGDVLQYSFDGNFDFSGLAIGTYNIYGISYVGPLNTPDNIEDYLANLSPNNFITIVLDDNDNSSGGPGNGSFCLDVGNAGFAGHATSVEVYGLPAINGTSTDCAVLPGDLTIDATGVGTLEYSIDGINFQASNVFFGAYDDTYTVTVRDLLTGCESILAGVEVACCPDAPLVTGYDFASTTGITIQNCSNASDGSDIFFIGAGPLGYAGFTGDYFTVQDKDAVPASCSGNGVLTFDPIDVTGYTLPVSFEGLFAALGSTPAGTSSVGGSDVVQIDYSVDNGAFDFGIKFVGSGGSMVPQNESGQNIGSFLGTAARKYGFDIPADASTITLRVTVSGFTSAAENFAFDEFYVRPPCGLFVGDASVDCDPLDLYTVTIPYTNSDNSICPRVTTIYNGSGTVIFEPTVVDGEIIIIDIPEGEDWEIMVVGGEGGCGFTLSGASPVCDYCEMTPPPSGNIITISTCLTEGSPAEQNEQAEMDPFGTSFVTWNAAVVTANALNIDGDPSNDVESIVFEPGYYTDFVGNSNDLFGTLGMQLSGLNIYGNDAVVYLDETAGQGSFAAIEGNDITFWDLNLDNFNSTSGAIATLHDVTGIEFNNCTFNASDRSGEAMTITNSTGITTSASFNCCLFSNQSDNTADRSALYISGGENITVDFLNTDFICNERMGNGGAIQVTGDGAGPNLNVVGGTFANNHARGTAGKGGAIYISEGTLYVEGTNFIDNSCETTEGEGGGGAIFLSSGSVIVYNSNFSNNTSANNGGAVCVTGFGANPVFMNNNTFVGNTATAAGGAVFTGDRENLEVINCLIDGNTAGNGSALYVKAGAGSTRDQTVFYLSGTTVTNNNGGAAVHVDGSETSDDTDPTTEDVITVLNSILCNNTGSHDYRIREDLQNGFSTATASTEFVGSNIVGVGNAIGDITADYAMGTCDATPAEPLIAAVACPPAPAATNNCDADWDQDGIVDSADLDDDNDGIPDFIEGIEDTDGDGLIDSKDLDADDDGIPDIIEAGGVDADGNGLVDNITGTTLDNDDDMDGWANDYDNDDTGAVLGGTPETLNPNPDTDGDGLNDYVDLDADNDGIPDIQEVNPTNNIDADNNGMVDDGLTACIDADIDGFCDLFDPTDTPTDTTTTITFTPGLSVVTMSTAGNFECANGSFCNIDTTNPDGNPNHLDLDADNDGIVDIVEAGGTDDDGNGLVDGQIDTGNNNGWHDLLESSGNGYPIPNTDATGLPDWLDIDADDDGITDNVEAQSTNGYQAPLFTDSDNDGLDDQYDNHDGFGGVGAGDTPNANAIGEGLANPPYNYDQIDEPDYLDLDSDNDLVNDVDEAWDGTDGDDLSDVSGCGTTDADNDGLLDCYDSNTANPSVIMYNNPPDDDGGFDAVTSTGGASGNISGTFPNNSGQGQTALEPDWRDTAPDADNDNIPDDIDLDDDNDGISDLQEGGDDADFDGDGVPNRLDLDSDNDGLADIVEANPTDLDNNGVADVDEDGDGRVDDIDGMGDLTDDADNDGWDDTYDNVGGTVTDGTPVDPLNTDSNGNPDYLDIDADDDGIVDVIEWQTTTDYIAPTGFWFEDGWDNALDGIAVLTDTDGDGMPDYLDLDSDGDGESDTVEAYDLDDDGTADTIGGGGDSDGDGLQNGFDDLNLAILPVGNPDNGGQTATDPFPNDDLNDESLIEPDWRDKSDSDGDGIPDSIDLDDDNDGISDVEEGGNTADFDGDGIPNRLDLDSDNDGLADIVEANPTDSDNNGVAGIDEDGDGMVAAIDPDGNLTNDGDNNGWDNTYDSFNGGTSINPLDTDTNGGPDYLDIDADDDGIVDVIEWQTTAGYIAPTGAWDGDGWDNALQGIAVLTDTDANGTPDYQDLDSDGDGESDIIEAYDLNDNGTADTAGGTVDADADGLLNGFDNVDLLFGQITNPDNGGQTATNPFPNDDLNNASVIEPDWRDTTGSPDFDGDGIPDDIDLDDDNDGLSDIQEGGDDADFDNDGVPNRFDLDSDNDGLADIVEADPTDLNNNGVANIDEDGNGMVPAIALNGGLLNDGDNNGWDNTFDNVGAGGTPIVPLNTDTNGEPDFLDIDADDDGIADVIEWQTTLDYIVPTGSWGLDGWDDALDGVAVLTDTDDDGIPDYMDLDSDGDGEGDTIEAYDLDDDGVADTVGGTDDLDGDGLLDGFDLIHMISFPASNADNVDQTATDPFPNDDLGDQSTLEPDWRDVPALPDNDNDGIPDVVDLDDDNDGLSDFAEGGDTADQDGDGIPNRFDLDSDNDGLADIVEADPTDNDGNNVADIDEDGNGMVANMNPDGTLTNDADNDGWEDIYDNAGGAITNGVPIIPDNTDSNGAPDYLDIDADDDGIVDIIEWQPTAGYIPPSGVWGDDGWDDALAGITVLTHTDGDGIPDWQDINSDNDFGIDALEAYDLDNDGDQDVFSNGADSDNDGLLDGFDLVDLGGDPVTNPDNGGQVADNPFPNDDANNTSDLEPDWRDVEGPLDTDGDGIADKDDLDDDNDGISDGQEGGSALDSDGDGIPNRLDLDSDNDGIPDIVEAFPLDTDNNGVADIDEDGDGLVDLLPDGGLANDADDNGWDNTYDNVGANGTPLSPLNTDGTGMPDFLDIDADDDGIVDVIEWQMTVGYIASTGAWGADGWDDALYGIIRLTDTDGDNTPDYRDLDSDGDGEDDAIEAYDTDDDGVADVVSDGTDFDNDGLFGGYDLVLLFISPALNPNNFGQTATSPFPNDDAGDQSAEEPDWRDIPQVGVCLTVKTFLQGALLDPAGGLAYNPGGLMRDDLRAGGYLPLTEPYTAIGTTFVGGGGETVDAAVFDVTGTDAIVDWVILELRDANDPKAVVASRAALIQRDGDVVDLDGVSSVIFTGVTDDSYYVVVNHRNHLGAMTAAPIPLTTACKLVDFTTMTAADLWDNPAGVINYDGLEISTLNNVNALWFGDCNRDGRVKYKAPVDDQSSILIDVLLYPTNASFQSGFDFAFGYYQGDVDMSGKVKYESPKDDQSLILLQILLYAGNTSYLSNYGLMYEQIAK